MEINVVKLKEYAQVCKVLYVEDDELIRSQTQAFLERFFPSIVLACDGKEGLEKYKEGAFDVVISDINMPEMNGIEMITEINKINESQIILVTSAHNDAENLISLINLGIMRFVLKPFNNKQFIIMLFYIVEEIHNKKYESQIEAELLAKAKESKMILDMLEHPLAIFDEGQVIEANKPLLTLYKAEDLEQLQRQNSNITTVFKADKKGLSVLTNESLLDALKTDDESSHRVMIEINTQKRAFHLKLTQIQDERYMLVFTDITALKDSMQLHRYTNLPIRQAVLEHIDSEKMHKEDLEISLFSLKNFQNIFKWNGKAGAIVADKESSERLKKLFKEHMPNAYLGYFGENQFLMINEKDEDMAGYKKAFASFEDTYNELLCAEIEEADINYFLKLHKIEFKVTTNLDIAKIELEILHKFDELNDL